MGRAARGGSKGVLISGLVVALAAAGSVVLNADFRSPPRYDGAAYAVLGLALEAGRGYVEINDPEPSPHAHFPPGYPAALAILWRATGRSVVAAHVLSAACTVAATLAAWWWFRGLYPPRVALVLGLAVATNWSWGRLGGTIQSEPLYLLLSQLAVLAETWAGRRGGRGPAIAMGIALASCTLTRHVGACLAAAAIVDLLSRRRWAGAAWAGTVAAALVLPWVVWLASVGRRTQAGLLAPEGLAGRVARQALFYVQRLPDQWTGPIVEIGTIFRRSSAGLVAVNAWAFVTTGVLIWGWVRAIRAPRRRLAGLVPLMTLPLLVSWPFTEAGRFLVPLVPFILVGAVEGLSAVAAMGRLRRPRAWASCAVLAMSLPYAGYAAAAGRAEAQRRAHRDFDAACAWLAREADRPGPVLVARYPSDVFWMSGRRATASSSDDPEAIARDIDRLGVSYVLIEDDRFANAPPNPLNRFVAGHRERVRRVWSRDGVSGSIAIFAVLPGSGGDGASGASR
jgi:hypothetical protein